MNIANKLTVARIILAFVFIFTVSLPGLGWKIVSTCVFICAALTDLLDGRIARRRNLVSDFGKLMDPIADKILVLAALVAFVRMQLVQDWMLTIIIFREILVTSLRLFALNKGKILSAGKAGKGKTFSQMVVIMVILLFMISKEVMKTYYSWNPAWERTFHQGINIFMWVVVVLTVYSGCSYLWRNRKLIASL